MAFQVKDIIQFIARRDAPLCVSGCTDTQTDDISSGVAKSGNKPSGNKPSGNKPLGNKPLIDTQRGDAQWCVSTRLKQWISLLTSTSTSTSTLTLTSALTLTLTLTFFSSCQPDLKIIEDITRLDEGPVESTYDMKIVYTERALVKMTLSAPKMDRYAGEKPYMEMPEGLEVFFYDTLGNITSSMSAKYAISYGDNELIEARNDVVVVNELNERLNTEHLVWDQQKEIIFSDKFVKITRADEILYGDGIEADERFTHWVIKKPRGNFTVETE